MTSVGARAYIEGPPVRSRGRAPGEGSGAKPPESESCAAFEALAEEPNSTLVTDSF